MDGWQAIHRFLSSWLAFVIVLGPIVGFILAFVDGVSDVMEIGVIVALALPLTVAFLGRGYSLDRLWSFVNMLLAGYFLILVLLIIFAFGLPAFFRRAYTAPSELGLGGQLITGILGSIVLLVLYYLAYQKSIGENNTTY